MLAGTQITGTECKCRNLIEFENSSVIVSTFAVF